MHLWYDESVKNSEDIFVENEIGLDNYLTVISGYNHFSLTLKQTQNFGFFFSFHNYCNFEKNNFFFLARARASLKKKNETRGCRKSVILS